MPATKQCLSCGGIIFGIVVLLFAIIFPFHFAYLDYYEFGFAKRTSSGVVDMSRVYTEGRYGIGIDHQFKIFPATAQSVLLMNIGVFTADKLPISISVAFQYFLRREDLPALHDSYDIAYADVMRSSAVDALKGKAPDYRLHQFFKEREVVETGLFEAVRMRLSGICCEPHCKNPGQQPSDIRCVGCQIPFASCLTKEKGLFVDVRYFQLRNIFIPADVSDRYLSVLIQGSEAERVKFVQESKVVEKETEKMVQEIKNEAEIIAQNATAQAQLIRARAEADAKAIVEQANIEGLQKLYERIGITDAKHKASFNYLRTLRDHNSAQLSVNFATAVLGPLGSSQ